jgi:Cys-rich repeat protein
MTLLRVAYPLGFCILLTACPGDPAIGSKRQDGGDDAGEGGTNPPNPPPGDAAAPDGSSDGGAPRGSGALCGANGRDDCGAFLLCAESLGCVDCTQDDDCPAAATHCLQGTCVGCRPGTTAPDGGPPDCPGAATACWTSDDECHAPCSDTNACPAGTTCDKVSGQCAGCRTDAECPSGVCSPTKRKCVDCVSDTTCPTSRPRCRVLTGTCQACTSNIDCGHAAPICDPTTFLCRVGCTTDAQCPGQRCDPAAAQCVALPVDAGTGDAGGDAQ